MNKHVLGLSEVMVLVFSGILLLAVCSQPPAEKVRSVEHDFNDCESRGARVFVSAEYETVRQDLKLLNELMKRRKYKQAVILADSLESRLQNIRRDLDKNGRSLGKERLQEAYCELDSLKWIMNAGSVSLLSRNELQMYQLRIAGFEKKASNLEQDMENGYYLRVYNGAISLTAEAGTSRQAILKRMAYYEAQPRKNRR